MSQYYIQLFSPHGLIRYKNPEIGRDTDTGGQVKYVLELLEALSQHEQVRKVDLFTRRIQDRRVSPTYAEAIEVVNEKARVIRISCGGKTYRKKETLWNYLDEFIDNTIRFNKGQNDMPDLVHGHYADGNFIANKLSKYFKIPFFSTAHSLGRNKQRILLEQGLLAAKINEQFNIKSRIKVEEEAMAKADLIIASTQHEINLQYQSYDAFDKANFMVLPPGINQELFYPFYRQNMPSFEMSIEQEQALYRVTTEIERFLFDPNKPLILSIGRPDKRKNFETIIEAYGSNKELQTMANLAIFAGVRKDISQMVEDEQEILTNLLLLMDKYDLYGKLAIPKKNDPKLDIPEIYRLAARKKGVFVNATPGENFGLTIVEAGACGLPVIASPSGGPKEILEKCENGLLIDVENIKEMAASIKKIIADATTWETYSTNGIKGVHEHFSWQAHAAKYLSTLEKIDQQSETDPSQKESINIGKKMTKANVFFISDLDGTLINDDEKEQQHGLNEFKDWVNSHRKDLIFGIATGRNQHLTKKALEDYDLPEPDILICSAGSELYYTKDFIPDSGWESHISYRWNREKLEAILKHNPKIRLQEEEAQWQFKLSYYVDPEFNEDDLANLYQTLDNNRIKANILLTDNNFLDLLPYRASKGNALKYLSFKWKVPMDQFLTAGNGGNDIDMLRGKPKGIVVSNYSPELERLKKSKDVYFAGTPLAEGVLEGINFHQAKLSKNGK